MVSHVCRYPPSQISPRAVFPFPSMPIKRRPTLSWLATYHTGGAGHAADARSSYRQGYQVVDNYLVRVLAGKSAWDLPPGRVGEDELQVRVHPLAGTPTAASPTAVDR